MTDITELARREKFEAWWEREYKHLESSKYTDTVPHIKYGFWAAYQAGGSELVEALEKARQVDEELCKLLPPGAEYMDPPDGGDVTPLEGVRRMVADYRQRIAELESRTVTVKLPDYRNTYKGPFADEVEHQVRLALELFSSAAGIKWEAE
ncbi:hypothetical protein [Klebsiella grimontii]|uniref:hypothetical protein n=1 Tax=Klebsiella grimontii TaxID=2058152 RepID=UPI0012B946F7|nr:hypothetical protein [Klebsiella grimontii]